MSNTFYDTRHWRPGTALSGLEVLDVPGEVDVYVTVLTFGGRTSWKVEVGGEPVHFGLASTPEEAKAKAEAAYDQVSAVLGWGN